MTPVPKPEKGSHSVEIYMTKTFKHHFRLECRKRGVSMSTLGRLSIYDYLQPRPVIIQGKDTTWNGWQPKKSITQIHNENEQSGKAQVIKEIKKIFTKGFVFKTHSNKELGIKPRIEYGVKEVS